MFPILFWLITASATNALTTAPLRYFGVRHHWSTLEDRAHSTHLAVVEMAATFQDIVFTSDPVPGLATEKIASLSIWPRWRPSADGGSIFAPFKPGVFIRGEGLRAVLRSAARPSDLVAAYFNFLGFAVSPDFELVNRLLDLERRRVEVTLRFESDAGHELLLHFASARELARFLGIVLVSPVTPALSLCEKILAAAKPVRAVPVGAEAW